MLELPIKYCLVITLSWQTFSMADALTLLLFAVDPHLLLNK